MRIFSLLLFIVLYGYAFLRYHIGKDIPMNDWYFILNKSFAWMGFTLIALSILKESTLSKLNLTRRFLGLNGFGFAVIHACSIYFLFNQVHFPKFYTENQLNLIGWFALSIGFLSILIFSIPFIGAMKQLPNSSQVFRLGKIGMVISLAHPFIIGFSGWISPNEWPLFLPPITLLAVMSGVIILMIRALRN